MVFTSMTQEQADEFEKLPLEEQARQIRFAELAQLRPISEWLSDERIFELYDELAPAT